ncbi:MAG: hypothetical protein OXM59_01125 [Gammaproteobacteria bacterium]|nr:hypothetical protein [Gammaproteobacteria bacterium]
MDGGKRRRIIKVPAGWVAEAKTTRDGGQASVLYVRDGGGRKGVFRKLKGRVTRKARERFRREVGILSGGLVQHRSVVRLLDWDADAERPWYISERGDPFVEWWQHWKAGHTDPKVVVDRAINVVRQLADALGSCHEHSIVHRDVKPTNLVVKRGEQEPWPILIDFGLAYANESPRLTDSNEGVGNRRFSPDPARSRMDEVPAWLDLFALAQLAIWMLDEQLSARKSWQRPLHWRYAKYNPGLSEETLLAINAFTAACASESSAPPNGTQCVKLLDRLFPRDSLVVPTSSAKQVQEMRTGKRRGEATKKLAEARITEELESSARLAEVTYKQLREAILSVAEEIQNSGERVRVTVDNDFVFDLVGATDLLWLTVGPSDVNVQIRVKIKAIPASTPPPSIAYNVKYWRKYLPDDAICFGFAIEGGIVAAHNVTYLDGRWITIARSGGLYMHRLSASFGPYSNNDLGGSVEGPGEASSAQEIAAYALSVLTNAKYWEYIAATSEDND